MVLKLITDKHALFMKVYRQFISENNNGVVILFLYCELVLELNYDKKTSHFNDYK